jgi:CubicO group peptidase (beta-lactamase class C family)
MLRCSTADMLRMMAALLGRGQGDAAGVLAPETIKEIFKPQGIDPDQLKGPSPLVTVDSGLVWRMIELDGRRVWSHTGNGAGMATAVLLDDKAKAAGAVWVSGGALENKDGQIFFMDLLRRLLAEMLRS